MALYGHYRLSPYFFTLVVVRTNVLKLILSLNIIEAHMAYIDTLIKIAPDSTANEAVIPENKRPKKTLHLIQYELLTEKPYHYTHDELVFKVHCIRKNITDEELAINEEDIRADFFKKGHPCMRASALTKKYGWGAHYNDEGKIAIFPMESADYESLSENVSKTIFAMRASRKK